MTRRLCISALATATALTLSACGETEEPVVVPVADTGGAIAPDMNQSIDGAAGGQQAGTTYEAGTEASLESTQLRTEVTRLQEESSGDAAAKEDRPSDRTAAYTWLDRNQDGRLSPAEYALYELDDVGPAPNDEKAPSVSDEALNKIVMEFRRQDANGDFFLSQSEFVPAA